MTRIDPAWGERVLRGTPVAGLLGWRASSWEGGVRLDLQVRGGWVGLDLEARRDAPAYATTPSLSAYLRVEGVLPPGAEEVVRAVLDVLRAADPGGLEVTKGEQLPEDQVAVPVHDVPKVTREDAMMGWLTRAHALAEQLPMAAALAWRAHEAGGAYPFEAALGPVPQDELGSLRGWLLARWPSPPARDEVVAAWGEQGAGALMRVVEDLVGLGVVTVSDEGLGVHAGLGADPAIWAVWLWDPAVREAAAATWDLDVADARARLDAALGDAASTARPTR